MDPNTLTEIITNMSDSIVALDGRIRKLHGRTTLIEHHVDEMEQLRCQYAAEIQELREQIAAMQLVINATKKPRWYKRLFKWL